MKLEEKVGAVSYTHLDVYKRQVWRCGVGRAITFLMYFYGYTLCLECLYHRRVMATPLGIKGVAMLKYCI